MKDPFSDDIEPRKVVRKLLEKDIQGSCVDWMRSRGYWARKFSSPANRSVPDYLFSHNRYGKLGVEFKAPSKKSTDNQIEEQNKMREAGWEVWADVGSGADGDVGLFKKTVLEREHELDTGIRRHRSKL